MAAIEGLKAREILDSRGIPTLEVDVLLSTGHMGRASVPSGTSCGQFEAKELRDHDSKRYLGKGVKSALETIYRDIFPSLAGLNVVDQEKIDHLLIALDGTPHKEKLGGNTTLAISLAVARAAASSLNLPLYRYLGGLHSLAMPLPFSNILNGGAHANNGLDVQEFMIVPCGAEDFKSSMQMVSETYQHLKDILHKKGFSTAVGAEGGFAPVLKSHEEALDLVSESILKAGYILGDDIALALDVAASEFYKNNLYAFQGKNLSSEELTEIYKKWVHNYPIISLEDGMAEGDYEGWKNLTASLDIQLVGDDIFVSTAERLLELGEQGIANSILIKPNQVGTLSETFNTIKIAKDLGYSVMVSHRSGETEDTFIADLAVAVGCGQIKCGAPCRGERTAKYNQLLRIAEDIEP
jgi:enolase